MADRQFSALEVTPEQQADQAARERVQRRCAEPAAFRAELVDPGDFVRTVDRRAARWLAIVQGRSVWVQLLLPGPVVVPIERWAFGPASRLSVLAQQALPDRPCWVVEPGGDGFELPG